MIRKYNGSQVLTILGNEQWKITLPPNKDNIMLGSMPLKSGKNVLVSDKTDHQVIIEIKDR